MSQTDPVLDSSESAQVHPFGGCNRLLGQYQAIGTELLKLEQNRANIDQLRQSFREAVSFIAIEVLESYLEDLLDPDCAEDKLFIQHDNIKISSMFGYLAILGLVMSVCVGAYASTTGASILVSSGLTACLALPFILLWLMAPSAGLARRMGFAQVLSHEISRRRGSGKDSDSTSESRFSLGDFLGAGSSRSFQGAAFSSHK